MVGKSFSCDRLSDYQRLLGIRNFSDYYELF